MTSLPVHARTISSVSDPGFIPTFRVDEPNGCTVAQFEQWAGDFSDLDWKPATQDTVLAFKDGIYTINVVDVGAGCSFGDSADYRIRASVWQGAVDALYGTTW